MLCEGIESEQPKFNQSLSRGRVLKRLNLRVEASILLNKKSDHCTLFRNNEWITKRSILSNICLLGNEIKSPGKYM